MATTSNYLALDLGASGGRAIIGRFDGERLALEEVHRFANGPVHIPSAHGDSLHWDTLRLFVEIQEGLKKAVACCGSELISLGIDTWGVDYGLLDRNDRLVGLPYHYRDSRNDTMMAEAFRRVPREEIFAATGIQFMQLNTLFQLLAQQVEDPEVLARTRTLLMMPDLLNFWLTGQKVGERTIASTSQALDPYRPAWATGLLERLGIPTHYLPPIVEAGTVLGGLLPAVLDETGAKGVQVIAPGSHDTASADRGGASRERRLRLSQLRHVVLDRGGDSQTHHQRDRVDLQRDQRGRCLRHDPPAEEYCGAVDHPGVPAHMGGRRPVALLGRHRATRHGRAALRRADRCGRA